MCVLFTYHLWIHQCHCMCDLFGNNNESHFACVFSSQSTHGSTSVIACVFFLVTTTSVIACVLSSETTHGSTSAIACVFVLLTTTRVIEMCALFRDHTWIH